MEVRNFFINKFRKFAVRQDKTKTDNIELVVVPSQNNQNEPSTSTSVGTSSNFQYVENLQEFFGSSEVLCLLEETSKVLLMKLLIEDVSKKPSLPELQELATKCSQNSIVLLLSTKYQKNFFLFWKSKEIQHFLILKLYDESQFFNNLQLFEFIAEFLTRSLKKGHLGIYSAVPINSSSSTFELHLLADHRNFNLLLVAAELGNIFIVEFFLDGGFSTEYKGTNAQTLAYNNQHYEIVLSLLKSNSIYPKSIDIRKCPDDIKSFYEVSNNLNKQMKAGNVEEVEKILNENLKMRHFYNLNNESALVFALRNKLWKMYVLLLGKAVKPGPHENIVKIIKKLKESERNELRDIPYNKTQFLPDYHLHVLLSNSRLVPGTEQQDMKYDKIRESYEKLNSHPLIQIILLVVAASRNFRIIFDFDQDSVEFIDPTANPSATGLFYISGRIYIAARKLLNPETEYEALGTLAHELCHFAVHLVFNNLANPYKFGDRNAEEKFEEISKFCERNHEFEKFISYVYKLYSKQQQHAELIVRVPHLVILYVNNQQRLTEVEATFDELFKIYKDEIVPKMKEALPKVETKAENEAQKNIKKIRHLTLTSIFIGLVAILGIISAIVVGFMLYTPTFIFWELSAEDQISVIKAQIIYKNTSLEFHELFPENSTVYGQLTSDHISQMLDGVPMDFSDPHLHYLEEQISHKWENLTDKLKLKFLTSNFTFQNESLKFKDLHDLTPVAFASLRSDQIIKVLDGKELVVHEMIENETKFYVERNFIDESINAIYYEFMIYLKGNDFIRHCTGYNNTKSNESFEDFFERFVNQSLEIQFKKIDKNNKRSNFLDCRHSDFKIRTEHGNDTKYKWIITDTLSSYDIDFNQVLKIANETKMFILSDEAGTGKTVTFEQFTMRIKRKFPTRWVSYVDLKDHKNFYKKIRTLQDVKNMLATIFKLSSDNEFELRVFEDLFDSGNVIILWNGFDEISPEFSDDVIRILRLIRNETQNIQFICTRPLYSRLLMNQINLRTYTLVPLNKKTQINFVKQFFKSKKIEEVKIPNYVEKVKKIINSMKSKEDFNAPLMLGMFAELVANDVEIYETENLYQIYEKFVSKKIEIWKENNEFGSKFLSSLGSKNSGFNMMNLYELFALNNEGFSYRKILISNTSNLKIMHLKVPEELTSDEISRMGILYINGPKNIKFAHKTFSEFFAAKFIIDKIYNEIDEVSDKEANDRAYVFLKLFDLKGVRRFIKSYLESKDLNKQKSFNLGIIKKFIEIKKSVYFYIDGRLYDHILLIKFFQNDPISLKIILLIDEDETFYTRLFNYVHRDSVDSYSYLIKIKEFLKPLLSDEEMVKLISGKNQKGKILFSSYFDRKIPKHDLYFLNETLLRNSDAFYVFKTIVETLTIDEFKALLEIKDIWDNIYKSQYKFKNTRIDRLTFDEKMWKLIEKKATKSDQKEILLSIFKSMSYSENEKNLNYKLNISNHLLSNDEIFNLFNESNVLFKFERNSEEINILWEFFAKHTNESQQKEILKSNRILLFYSIKFDNYFMIEVYESLFEPTEIKDIFFSTDFLEYFNIYGIDNLVKYLEKLALKACSGPCFEEVYKLKAELEEEEEEEVFWSIK